MSFEEHREKYNLQPLFEVQPTPLPRQIVKQLNRHGKGPAGKTCGECDHLLQLDRGYRKRFFKCELYGRSSSAASDWRKKWPACGQFKELRGDDDDAK